MRYQLNFTETNFIVSTIHRYSTKTEILQLLKSTKGPLNLKVVAGGLAPASKSSTVQRSGRSKGRGQQNISHKKIAIRYEKARLFHHKVKSRSSINSLMQALQDYWLFL